MFDSDEELTWSAIDLSGAAVGETDPGAFQGRDVGPDRHITVLQVVRQLAIEQQVFQIRACSPE